LKKVAKCFGVTTDWLLFENAERGPDEDLRLQFEAMSQLSNAALLRAARRRIDYSIKASVIFYLQ
jgi:hypothetical protein